MKPEGEGAAYNNQRSSSQKFPKLNDVPTNVLQENLRIDILKFLRSTEHVDLLYADTSSIWARYSLYLRRYCYILEQPRNILSH